MATTTTTILDNPVVGAAQRSDKGRSWCCFFALPGSGLEADKSEPAGRVVAF